MVQLLSKIQRNETATVLIIGGSSAILLKAFGSLVQFLLQLILARSLGAAELGKYLTAIAWVDVLVLIAKMGLDIAAFKYIASYYARQDLSALKGFLLFSLKSTLIVGSSISVILGIILSLISGAGNAVYIPLLLALPLIPLLALTQVQSAVLRGLGSYARSIAPYTLIRHSLLVVFLLALWLGFSAKLDAERTVLLTLFATSITFLLTTLWLRKMYFRKVKYQPELNGKSILPSFETREWFRTTLPMMFVGSSVVLLNQTDIITLGFLATKAEVGIYGPMSRLALLVVFGYQAINSAIKPRFAALHSQDKVSELQTLTTWTTRAGFAFSILAVITFLILGERITYLFGKEFTAGYPVLMILMVGRVIDAFTGPAQDLLVMTGHQDIVARILIGIVLLNIVLNILLTPIFGIIGAASATATTIIVWKSLAVFLVHKRLRIKTMLL